MTQQGLDIPIRSQEIARPTTARKMPSRSPLAGIRRGSAMIAVPAAAGIALLSHYQLADHALSPFTHSYPTLLASVLIAGLFALVVQLFWPRLRDWLQNAAPLLAAAILALAGWEIITLKAALLPIMYFPPPELVLQTLLDDHLPENHYMLVQSTWSSLNLLLRGYAVGVICGLISGVTIGWSARARYWGMPILKIVGPIPATAWIPMALVIFPRSGLSGIALIALTVWFPVTMLTASGVSNTRASYLDVARTLGAGRAYLIFRVAIPAAMPSIFIGLFMGLGASFLTLLVAESTGVRSGLGWYIDWARNYSDYTKVFAALVIMALFFSTIMTLLFKVRDRILVWQKGVIKW